MTSFVFYNDEFNFEGGNYTPSSDFSIVKNKLIVSIVKPNVGVRGTPEFLFKYKDISSNFAFQKASVFYLNSQDYTPDTLFKIPQDANSSASIPDVEPGNVIRYITSSVCSSNRNSYQISKRTKSNYEQAFSSSSNSCSSTDNATSLNPACWKIVTENATAKNVNKCAEIETALFLSRKTLGIFEIATETYPEKSCSINETATSLDKCVNSDFQLATILDPTKKCSIIQDTADTVHSFTFRYWNEVVMGDNYTPDTLFSISSKSEYDDNRSVKAQPSELLFEFFDSNYTPSNLFSIHANTLPVMPRYDGIMLPLNLYFYWPGVWQEFKNSDSYQIGGYRASTCSGWGVGQFKDFKKCSIIEEGSYPKQGKTPWIDYERPDIDPNPPSGATIIVPRQEVYTMQNIITATLDDGITKIRLQDLSISNDADSFTRQFSASLIDPSQIGLVKQLQDGTAIKLFITVNGAIWHVLVEKIAISRIYKKQSVKISGRGLTALLSKPYEQPTSVNFGGNQDIRNLVDAIMPLGWNELGDLYWLLGDNPVSSPIFWNVPGGAYSYTNKTPIEALSDLAKDIGAMIIPSRDSQEIYFKSRYPVLPWFFDSVNVDISIPDSAIIHLTEEPVSSFQANGVYVHGNEIGGKLAFVRLNGTAGDRLAPTVNNSLLTDAAALRSIGERILSGQYSQPKIKSITTFMDGVIVPLVEIGDFIEFIVDGIATRGIVNAVSLNANLEKVTQTITIGESTPNEWVAFKEILPKDPMLVATLSSTDGVTSLMSMIDGGVVRVRGTGTVNNKYYIRSGEIVSAAPNLSQANIIL